MKNTSLQSRIEIARKKDLVEKSKWVLLYVGIPVNTLFIFIDLAFLGLNFKNILVRLGFIPFVLLLVSAFRFELVKRTAFLPIFFAICYLSFEETYLALHAGFQAVYVNSLIQNMLAASLVPLIWSEFLICLLAECIIMILGLYFFAPSGSLSELGRNSQSFYGYAIVLFAVFYGFKSLRAKFYKKEIELEDEIANRDLVIAEQVDQISKTKVQEAIAETAKGLAHDVKKPFGLLRMAISLIKSDQSENTLNLVEKEVSESLKSVERMLTDIVEAENNSVPIVNEVSIARLIKNSLRASFIGLGNLNIELRYFLDSRIYALVDEEKLIRVFSNIISNATEAMNGNGIITFRAESIKDNLVLVSIMNDGPPISASVIQKVFEPYATDKKNKGTGLGLFIAKRIVERHGGTICCESSEDGVTFKIELPSVLKSDSDVTENLANRAVEFHLKPML